MEASKIFGERLRLRLEALKLTHQEFADKVGVARSQVSKYLAGNTSPGVDILVSWADALGTDPNYLLGKDQPSPETFGTRLVALRKARGWNQSQLADLCSVDQKQVSRWEAMENQPQGQSLMALASAFGITVAELTGVSEKLDPKQESLDSEKLLLLAGLTQAILSATPREMASIRGMTAPILKTASDKKKLSSGA